MVDEKKRESGLSGAYSGLKVLVTGGAGYFGHRLGKALKKDGADVTLFDCRKLMDCEGMNFIQVSLCRLIVKAGSRTDSASRVNFFRLIKRTCGCLETLDNLLSNLFQ